MLPHSNGPCQDEALPPELFGLPKHLSISLKVSLKAGALCPLQLLPLSLAQRPFRPVQIPELIFSPLRGSPDEVFVPTFSSPESFSPIKHSPGDRARRNLFLSLGCQGTAWPQHSQRQYLSSLPRIQGMHGVHGICGIHGIHEIREIHRIYVILGIQRIH